MGEGGDPFCFPRQPVVGKGQRMGGRHLGSPPGLSTAPHVTSDLLPWVPARPDSESQLLGSQFSQFPQAQAVSLTAAAQEVFLGFRGGAVLHVATRGRRCTCSGVSSASLSGFSAALFDLEPEECSLASLGFKC